MKTVQPIQSFEQIKLLADSRRMEILRLLMDTPATLTHLAHALQKSPAWIRHHILALESGGLVEVSEVRRTGKVVEKYYRAKGGAFLLQEIVLPRSKQPAVIFSGSHDLALEEIIDHLHKHVTMLSLPVGSLDGLVNLRQGLCQISGAHILDETGEYNTPTVRHLFPDRNVELVTLAHRTQGLIVAPGNPKGIKKISDLVRRNIRFINRNSGSGTRIWFNNELKKGKLSPDQITGYDQTVKTHSEAALAVASNNADAALGLQAAAKQHNLDFIPLFEERYDLILPRENEKKLSPLLDYLQTSAFRSSLGGLVGYNPTHSGEQILV